MRSNAIFRILRLVRSAMIYRTHTHTHTHQYIDRTAFACMCVCVCAPRFDNVQFCWAYGLEYIVAPPRANTRAQHRHSESKLPQSFNAKCALILCIGWCCVCVESPCVCVCAYVRRHVPHARIYVLGMPHIYIGAAKEHQHTTRYVGRIVCPSVPLSVRVCVCTRRSINPHNNA